MVMIINKKPDKIENVFTIKLRALSLFATKGDTNQLEVNEIKETSKKNIINFRSNIYYPRFSANKILASAQATVFVLPYGEK